MPLNLHSPNRPTTPGYHPAFEGGMIRIPHPTIWPLDATGEMIRVSMMLPVKEAPSLMATWFSCEIPTRNLPEWLEAFTLDPEGTIIETLSSAGGFTPNLQGQHSVTPHAAHRTPPTNPHLLDDL